MSRRIEFDHSPTLDEVREAVENVPAWPGSEKSLSDYAQYILPLKQTRKEGEKWVNTWLLYVGVDGRIRMFQDAHMEMIAKHGIVDLPSFQIVSVEETNRFLKVTVRCVSPFFGTSEDIATADLQAYERYNKTKDRRDMSVDVTHPYENAVTSARGRVLGSLGFGILPAMGLASAEEILDAKQRQEALKEKESSSEDSQDVIHENKQTPPASVSQENINKFLTIATKAYLGTDELPENADEITQELIADFAQEMKISNNPSDWTIAQFGSLITWAKKKRPSKPDN
ncbi:MAG: hypothetical protein WC115_03565 [Sphaerochaeta sp.]